MSDSHDASSDHESLSTSVEVPVGAGHAAGSKNPLLNPDPGVAVWTFVTFFILLFVLKKLAWTPMLATLDKREEAIRQAVTEAERARASAASSIEEQQRLLAEARREAQELLAKSRGDAERAREEMVQRARVESEKVIEAGRKAIEQEKLAALDEIRKTTVELTLAATSKLLRKRVDDAQSRELVQSYIKELETTGRG